MKLRILGNSIRLRLGRSEVMRLAAEGVADGRIDFRPGLGGLTYAVEWSDADEGFVSAAFTGHRITVRVPRPLVVAWAMSDRVSIEASQPIGGGASLSILIEKDFACADARPGESQDDAFPNPPRCDSRPGGAAGG